MKRRFSNKIIKKPQNIQPIGFWNCFHSISPAELETLGQRALPQQAGARGHDIQQSILSPFAPQPSECPEQMPPLSSHQPREDTAWVRRAQSSRD